MQHSPILRRQFVLALGLFLTFGVIQTVPLAAQSFTEQTNLLSTDTTSGVAMGVVDMNGDGLDDIVRLNDASDLRIEYQTTPNASFGTYVFGNLGSSNEWGLCVGDYDNNGFNDIMAGGAYNNLKLLTANATGSSYSSSTLPGGTIFLQGSNFVDINNDGLLDIFACHDDADSVKFRNTGSGFVSDSALIDTAMPTGNDGNYASIWTDYDNDGDLDMYLSKCRGGVSDSTDPRRINRLFQNDGSNQFVETGIASGLNIGAQTWATDFGDIDNDGDLDCFVMNHDVPSQLLVNNGDGTFTDVTATSGMTASDLAFYGIQCAFRDFDNDGFVDLLVAGDEHRLFHNNGDGTFTRMANPFNSDEMESFAIGDLNSDGYLDIFAGYAFLFNSPSSTNDDLFMNDGGTNNFFSVLLKGTDSNVNGVGARLELYGSWGVQIREVRSGEAYGIMNSLRQHFGIGSATAITKLVVRWPSGTVDEWDNPAINQLANLVEASTIPEPIEALASKLLTGQVTGGSIRNISDSNDMYMEFDPAVTTNPQKQRVDLILLGEAEVGQTGGLSFVIEASMMGGPSGDVLQTAQLFNYSTRKWEDIETTAATNSDSVMEVDVAGDSSVYVHPTTGQILGRVTWSSPLFTDGTFDWSIDLDNAMWTIE